MPRTLPSLPPSQESAKPPAGAVPPGFDAQPFPATLSDARLQLQQLRGKMARLAEDFAHGKINRIQFQEIYAHYQMQRNTLEAAIDNMPGAAQWQNAFAPGKTALLLKQHAAKVLSYSIYDNATGMPLASIGEFEIDTALLVPMLSSFRSATAEMFGGGLRSTEIEGGHWLCFVPGRFTTLFVIFSAEPAKLQLTLIEDLHRDFEVANQATLESGMGEEAAHLFTQLWALDRVML
jgi:hypothetical protein